MSLLEGGIRTLFGRAFSRLFLDGTLHKVQLVDDGVGGMTEAVIDYPIKVQVDRADEVMRETPGYTATDCKLIVLQDGVPVLIDTADRITARGSLWSVMGFVRRDPADSQWIVHGVHNKVLPPSSPTDTGGVT